MRTAHSHSILQVGPPSKQTTAPTSTTKQKKEEAPQEELKEDLLSALESENENLKKMMYVVLLTLKF